MSECVCRKGGSKKYVLLQRFKTKCHFGPSKYITTKYCVFFPNGILYIEPGYEWDGPSGPTIDTDDFMDGALVHDICYQLLREGRLRPWGPMRRKSDKELVIQCKKDGMPWWRRWYVWLGVRIGGAGAAK
jgi:hypothetical protein